MTSIFTRIIDGEIPGRFVWRDDICVAFLDVRPLARGHVLVVPRAQIDQWTELSADTVKHMMGVAHTIGIAQKAAFDPARIGLLIAGFEVAHVHIHVVPLTSMANLDFSQADVDPDPADLDLVRATIVEALGP